MAHEQITVDKVAYDYAMYAVEKSTIRMLEQQREIDSLTAQVQSCLATADSAESAWRDAEEQVSEQARLIAKLQEMVERERQTKTDALQALEDILGVLSVSEMLGVVQRLNEVYNAEDQDGPEARSPSTLVIEIGGAGFVN